jgi:hypothetical protein
MQKEILSIHETYFIAGCYHIHMSTHRKIEWSLFILGLAGLLLSIWLGWTMVEIALFAAVTLFAGLHVFHLYDGHKSNHVVVAGSLALVAYTAYLAITSTPSSYIAYASLGVGVLLSILSLRLRRDFHKK